MYRYKSTTILENRISVTSWAQLVSFTIYNPAVEREVLVFVVNATVEREVNCAQRVFKRFLTFVVTITLVCFVQDVYINLYAF